jgi:hypothetical protein
VSAPPGNGRKWISDFGLCFGVCVSAGRAVTLPGTPDASYII